MIEKVDFVVVRLASCSFVSFLYTISAPSQEEFEMTSSSDSLTLDQVHLGFICFLEALTAFLTVVDQKQVFQA